MKQLECYNLLKPEVASWNQAESVVYQTKKQLKELGDKVPAEVKEKVEAKLGGLKDAISEGSAQGMKDVVKALHQEVIQLGQSLYSQPGGSAGPAPEDDQGPAGNEPEGWLNGEVQRLKMTFMAESFNQIFVTLLDDTTRCLQFPSPTVSDDVLKHHLSLTGIPASVQRLVTGSLNVNDDTPLSASTRFSPSCTLLLLRLCAGKGGFRGIGQKRTNNFDACHDTSGQRLRHINAEKMLDEWKAEAEDWKLEKLAEQFLKKKAKEVKKNSLVDVGIDESSEEDGKDEKPVVLDDWSKDVGGTLGSAS